MKYQWKPTDFPRRLRARDEMNEKLTHRLSSDQTILLISCAQSNPVLPTGILGGIMSQ